MGTKVRVQNYQSIEDAEIELEGLTVITGTNNSGKSAMLRAVAGVFSNTRGHHFVRHGAKHCTVSLQFETGDSVVWEKGEGINRYIVNGKLLDKVGAGVPDEVAALGVRPVNAGNETFWPQIGAQVTGQVFLLDKPGSQIAEAVADVERVGVCNDALRLVERDRRQNAATLKVRQQDVESTNILLAKFNGLDTVEAEAASLGEAQQHLIALRGDVLEARAFQDKLRVLRNNIAKLTGVREVQVPSQQDLDAVAKVKAGVEKCLDLQARIRKSTSTIAGLSGIVDVALPEVTEARDVSKSYQDTVSLQRKHAAALALVTKLGGLAGVDTDTIAPMISEAQEAGKVEASVKGLKVKYQSASRSVSTYAAQAEAAGRDLLACIAERDALLKQLGHCPTCRRNCGTPEGH